MKKKRFFSVLFVMIAFLFLLLPLAFAENSSAVNIIADGKDGEFTWTLDSAGVLTVAGKGTTLPESFCIGDYSNPGEWYNYTNDIKELVIDCEIAYLNNIGMKVCSNLTALTIKGVKALPDGSYSNGVFSNCNKLQIVTLGSGVKELGAYTFHGCSDLQNVYLGSDVLRIGNSAFGLCRKLESVIFSSGDVTIEKSGFAFCGNNQDYDLIITIPNGKTVIMEDAFHYSDATVYFLGDIPDIQGELNMYTSGKVVCYYPCDNETWDTTLPITAEWHKNHVFSTGTPTIYDGNYHLDYKCEICKEADRAELDFITCAGAAFSVTQSGVPVNYTVSTTDGAKVNELGTSSTGVWINNELVNGKAFYKFSMDEPGFHKLIFKTENSASKTFLIYLRSHEWNSGVVTSPANCKNEGVKTFTCSLCKSTRTESIPQTTNHVWNNGIETKAATTDSEGEITITCHVCGATKKETTPKLCKHDWGKGTIFIPASFTEAGKMEYTCSLCGEKMWTVIPKLEVKSLPGDVDGDGKLSAADARLALRKSVGLEDYKDGSDEFIACDVDFDGKVSAADARLILRASVGLEDPKNW